ncbi:MAG: helix-turn-helix domain-containing protein [Lewinella sp.]|uniref:helix-turn-helix domain-containing protein n=1 Tax=Lewinella sp. TaxID=2004506 RepID=UPI003D6B846E
MKQEFTDRKLGAIFGYTDHLQKDTNSFSIQEGVIQFLWNRNDEPVSLHLDDLDIQLEPGQLLTTTYFQHLRFPTTEPPLTALLFNREFYCIADHDEEVSCNGILFFGTQDLPIITIPAEQKRKFELLLEVILEEFRTVDNIQGDMLQMLLKRLIIICTRLAKEQLIVQELNDGQIDTIRQFNVLVDKHFRTLRKVKDYADLLHKSPKTLSNLFSTYNQQSPQQIIQERVVLEAKRLILFTDKQTQEIAYDLGFDDPAYFSRFFKKQAGLTPSAFREQHVLG